jgi:hypothetical protein
MAWMMVYGCCLCCGRTFSFNPSRVPSLTVNGTREPVCRSCMDRGNAKRTAMGLPAHPIDPEAYEPEEVA